jgi:hypothetical protein
VPSDVAVTDTHPKDEAAGWAELGAFLRSGREQQAMTLDHVARVTRIPAGSLARLEEGAFSELPAAVFVRGFLRSYARCVGLDADEVVARYGRCCGAEQRVTDELAAVDRGAEPARADADAELPDAEALPEPATARGEPTMRTRLQATSSFVARQLFEREPAASRRGPVTLAVIIVVIVATLTMSYLLRRPSGGAHGITRAPTAAAPLTAVAEACMDGGRSRPAASV